MADASLFDDPDGPAGARTWTVAELSAHLGRVLAAALPDDVWVEGQIRNLSRSANGHVYFQLTDPVEAGRPPKVQLAVTLLAAERQHVNDQLRRAGGAVRMDDGIEVRVQGRLRWYGPRGVLQLRMHGIDPAFTIGRLQADRDRILQVLAAERLLDANAARPFPLVPLRVGLVTSRGSAAHADVLSELTASGYGFQVRSVDARTQGHDCAPSVVRALRHLAAEAAAGRIDVILLVRGGGARTDLAGFDTELVARTIAAMPVPVLTGIGHEVDRSIADEVAHQAHKTPTAAAAALVRAVAAFEQALADEARAIRRAATVASDAAESRLARRAERVRRAGTTALGRNAARLDRVAATLVRRAPGRLDQAERTVAGLEARVRAHDPALVLARGFSITTTAAGALVRDPADAPPGTELRTRVAGGTITSTTIASPTTTSTTTPEDQP